MHNKESRRFGSYVTYTDVIPFEGRAISLHLACGI